MNNPLIKKSTEYPAVGVAIAWPMENDNIFNTVRSERAQDHRDGLRWTEVTLVVVTEHFGEH